MRCRNKYGKTGFYSSVIANFLKPSLRASFMMRGNLFVYTIYFYGFYKTFTVSTGDCHAIFQIARNDSENVEYFFNKINLKFGWFAIY